MRGAHDPPQNLNDVDEDGHGLLSIVAGSVEAVVAVEERLRVTRLSPNPGPLPRLRARGSNGLSTRRGLVVAGGRGFARTSAPRAASAPTLGSLVP